MTSDQPEDARTHRPMFGVGVVGIVAVVGLFLLGDAAINGSWAQMLLLAPWPLLAIWIVYEISAASFLRVDDRGATVQNLLRRTTFGWRRVREIDFRWQLELALDDGSTVTAFGGPARSRPRRQTRAEREVEGEQVPAGIRLTADLEERRRAAGEGADAPIVRSWDWPAIVAIGVIAAWAIVAVLIVNAS